MANPRPPRPALGGRGGRKAASLLAQRDGEGDEATRGDAAEEILAGLPGAPEDDEQTLLLGGREALELRHCQVCRPVGAGGHFLWRRVLVERHGRGVDERALDGPAL